jgi:hypothetical protein
MGKGKRFDEDGKETSDFIRCGVRAVSTPSDARTVPRRNWPHFATPPYFDGDAESDANGNEDE